MITPAELLILPHSVEAEQSVLGSLLLDNQAWDRVCGLLQSDDFYGYEHRQVFAAVATLAQHNRPADVVTVFEHLQSVGTAEDVGGLAYLNALAQCVPSAANISRYAEIVHDRSVLRRLVCVGNDIAGAAMRAGTRLVSDVLAQAEAMLLQIGDARPGVGQGFVSATELGLRLVDRVQALHAAGANEVIGVRTGFHALDRMTAGLQQGDLIVLAARPSMGKTALALNIAEQVAVTDNLPVLIFSMEMGADQLASRMTSSIGRIDQQRLRTGQLRDGDDDWGRFTDAVDRFQQAPLFIDDAAALTVADLRARARRKALELHRSPALIVVDYIQLMSGSGDENRATELAVVSRGLKALAKELGCPVIALSQLNRGVELRTDKRPMMSDLRDSGAIEQDADVILMLYRDDYYNKEKSKQPGIAELIVAKQRNGPTDTVELAFLKGITRFQSLGAAM